jgi:hypothetical protein
VDVREIHIAFSCTPVPAEHAIKSCAELVIVPLIDAAGVHPEVIQTVLCSSFSAETEFGVASLVLTHASKQLIVRDFFAFRPCVGQYRIGRNVVVVEGA